MTARIIPINRRASWAWVGLAVWIVLGITGLPTFSPPTGAAASGDRFGFVFVNGVEETAARAGSTGTWYGTAREAGARWNRWPIYWNKIETQQGVFDYSQAYPADTVVDADVRNGFKTNAILLGTPSWSGVSAQSVQFSFDVSRKTFSPLPVAALASGSPAAVPAGLDEPVLVSGAINPKNTYARFVFNTVQRYKPGGVLAQQRGWPAGQGVSVWELWNEPDLLAGSVGVFWQGGSDNYYKLVKAGYQAVKAADPNATVLMAGLSYWSDPGFLGRVLDRLTADSASRSSNFFFDALALHFYTNVHDVYDKTAWARQELQRRGLTKPIWMNETNLPVWGDTSGDSFGPWRGTIDQQAAYVIQAMAYSLAADIDRLLVFQFSEDGERAYGVVRNDGTPRPALTAYRVGATYLQDAIFDSRQVQNGAEIIRAISPTRGRVTVAWNTGATLVNAAIPASAASATLYDRLGGARTVVAANGAYVWPLAPGADYRDSGSGIGWHVDGDPVILVESGSPGSPAQTPTPAVSPTSTPVPLSSEMIPLSPTNAPVPFSVGWRRTDSSGGDGRFDVQYRIDNDPMWHTWIFDSTRTNATFGDNVTKQDETSSSVAPGHVYFFRARVRIGALIEDWPTSDQGDTFTITMTPTNRLNLPLALRGET